MSSPRRAIVPVWVLVLSACSVVPPAAPKPSVRQYSAETFFDTLSIRGSSVSADGTRLLVSSNATGTFRVYALPVDGGRAEPLTTDGEDAQFAVSWFPSDDRSYPRLP